MDAVTEPARAHNARPRHARWFQFPVTASALRTFDSTRRDAFHRPISAQKRREAILRLRDDVSPAIAPSTLNEKQTEKLDRRQTLLL